MLTTLFSHTPLWVWALLAFLVWRGLLAARTRTLDRRAICILPLVMIALSISSLGRTFADQPLTWMLAGFSTAACAALTWHGNVQARNWQVLDADHLRVTGSLWPLLLMLAIFVLKFAVSATLALHPEWAMLAGFAWPVAGVYGAISGYFLARMLRMLSLLKRSAQVRTA